MNDYFEIKDEEDVTNLDEKWENSFFWFKKVDNKTASVLT